MRRERMFINNNKHADRPELIEFTRRERDPYGSSQITNQKVEAKAVECSTSPFTNEFMICSFIDALGTKKDIRNIVFTNYDVKNPKFTTFKHHDSGEIVTKVDFGNPTICEILGHNNIGLTMNCRNKMANKDEDMDRTRGRGGGGNWS